MSDQNGHIRLKVIIGYLLLIVVTASSAVYVYNIIKQIAGGYEEPDSRSRKKLYLVTNTLSLVYESEALGQLVSTQQADTLPQPYDIALNKAERNMDTLRTLFNDKKMRSKIKRIKYLMEQKRENTRLLVSTWREINSEHIYSRNFERVIAHQDTIERSRELNVKRKVIVHRDTVYSKPLMKKFNQRRSFLRRLADVFSPPKEDEAHDTSVVMNVNTSRQTVTDTLVNPYHPTETIVTVLRSLQDSIVGQHKALTTELQERASKLRYSNTIITNRINQMLRSIEEEEMTTSLEKVKSKQKILNETAILIGGIASVALVVVIIFIIMIMHDVSRSQYYRKQLEKAKQYAEDLLFKREKLMLTISHDIRAPLSSIIGYIDLLKHQNPDEKSSYYLENMTGSANHILSLVNDLLDFHRLESGQMNIESDPFNAKDLFNQIYDSFLPLAEAKNLNFIMNLKEEQMDKVFLGDAQRIRQVVGNLLSNAIKFTSEGRVVLFVKCLLGEDYNLVVTVSDTGPGIPEVEQEKIFGEFTRLVGTEKKEGFGLGLSITRKLIELMGGRLTLHSIPGKGSDFTIVFPLKLSNDQILPDTAKEEEAEKAVFAGKDVHCLLVDDDPLQLAMTEELLKRNHVEVSCCTDSNAVLDYLKKTVFDAVITDIQMPGMDGYQLLKAVRSSGINGTDNIPVIALSASVEKEHTHYTDAGFTGFLNKPFSAKQLITLLNQLLITDFSPEKAVEFNFNSLTAFAGEDKEASASIVRTFTDETSKSIDLLQEALDKNDRSQASKVAHKLLPLFSMLGAKNVIAQLRMLEINDDALTDSGWQRLMTDVISQAMEIVEQAKLKL